METINIEELANAVAQIEYYNEIIEREKDKIRNLTNEEVEKLNKNNLVIINRKKYTKTTYTDENKQAKKEIDLKYPPIKTTFENHTIELTATSFSRRKAEEIRKLSQHNITTLKKAVASATKEKRVNKRG